MSIKRIITKDNSETFYNPEVDETYHSTSGAVEESIEKFAKPAILDNLAATASKDNIAILDLFFGMGYNSAAAIDIIKEKFPKSKITIIGLENDENILQKALEVSPNFKCYNLIKQAVQSFLQNEKENNEINFEKDNIKLKILIGNALQTIHDVEEFTKQDSIKFDAVFLDPFSPKKCPEFWSEDFMKSISRLVKKNGKLTTYSCASKVRQNLSYAGFKVIEGPCIGRRSPSLIAIKK